MDSDGGEPTEEPNDADETSSRPVPPELWPHVAAARRIQSSFKWPKVDFDASAFERAIAASLPDLSSFAFPQLIDSQQLEEMRGVVAASVVPPNLFDGVVESWLAQTRGQLDELTDGIRHMIKQLNFHRPENWPGDDEVSILSLFEFGVEQRVPIVWVPRAEIIVKMFNAGEDLGDVIVDASDEILEDCALQLGVSTHPSLGFTVAAMRQSLDAARAGLWIPAQSAASATYETLYLAQTVGSDLPSLKKVYEHLVEHPEDATILEIRQAILMSQAYYAWRRYRPKNDPIPYWYSRHGTTHALSPIQFTQLNALLVLMLATGMVREAEEVLRATSAADDESPAS